MATRRTAPAKKTGKAGGKPQRPGKRAAPAKLAPGRKVPPARRKAAPKPEPAPANPQGRPTLYNPEMAARICMGLLEDKSLRRVLEEDGMPGLSTVMRWLHDDAGNGSFREQYARAREWAAELSQDECLEIARNVDLGVVREVTDPQSGLRYPVLVAYDRTAVARARLEIATRQHLSAQRAPKRWGQLTGTAQGGGAAAGGTLVIVKDLTGRKD